MEVCMQDEVAAAEPEGPLVARDGFDDQEPVSIPIGIKNMDGVPGSFSDVEDEVLSSPTSDDNTSSISVPNNKANKKKNKTTKKRRSKTSRKSTVSSADDSSSDTSSVSPASSPRSQLAGDKGKEKAGDASGATAPEKGGSAPLPAVDEVKTSSSSSSSSSAAADPQADQQQQQQGARRNSAPEVTKQDTKLVSIPLLGRRWRLDLKFNHEIVPKEPKLDRHAERARKKEEKAKEKEEREQEKRDKEKKKLEEAAAGKKSSSEAGHHHGHHNPFHFLTNLFHHHHAGQAAAGSDQPPQADAASTELHAPRKDVADDGVASGDDDQNDGDHHKATIEDKVPFDDHYEHQGGVVEPHMMAQHTHSVAPKVEVAA